MSLIALALALSLPQAEPAPPPLPPPLFEAGIIVQSGYTPLLTIAQDGRWKADTQEGLLTPDQRTHLLSTATTVVLQVTEGPKCTSMPVKQLLRVPRGDVLFSVGCGPQPHASVLALRNVADALTVNRTPMKPSDSLLVRLDRWRPGKEALKESIILKRNGQWTTDNGVGSTGGLELDDLVASFDTLVLEVQPGTVSPGCLVDVNYEMEVPFRGRLRWTSPCQFPSPTMAVALAKLLTLARSVAPPR